MIKDNENNNGDMVDIGAMMRNYRRHWWWFVVSVVACVGLAFAYAKLHTPKYIANANILISTTSGEMSIMRQMGAFSSLLGAKSSVDDEMQVMKSHSLMKTVVEDMGLSRTHIERYGPLNLRRRFLYPEFPVDVRPENMAMLDTLGMGLRFKIEVGTDGKASYEVLTAKRKLLAEAENVALPHSVATSYGKFLITATDSYEKGKPLETEVFINGSHATAEDIAELLSIDLVSKKTNVINLTIDHANTDFSKDLLNKVMSAYNERALSDKNDKATKTLGFLDQRIAVVGSQLGSNEDFLEEYMRKNGLTNIEADVRFQMEMKGVLEEGLIKAEAEAAVNKMLLEFLNNPENEYSLLPASLGGESNITEAYNELILKRMSLEQNAKSDNRVLLALNDQIKAMRASVVDALRKSYDTSMVTLNELRQRRARSESGISRLPEQQREVMSRMRNQLIDEKILAYLLSQREETAMQITNAIPKGTIIDEAYTLNKPKGPTNKVLLAIALLMGLFIPPFLLYIRSVVAARIGNAAEASSATSLPVIGDIHMGDSANFDVVADGTDEVVTEDFRKIRARMIAMMRQAGRNIVVVASCSRGEGRSFVAFNLAASLSMLGKNVALVELDLRNGTFSRMLGVGGNGNITEHLCSGVMLSCDRVTVGDRGNTLSVYAAGRPASGQPELLMSEGLGSMMADLSEEYDYVVVDTASLDDYSDTLAIGHLGGVTLCVVRAGVTRRKALRTIENYGSELNNPVIVVDGIERIEKTTESR